MASGTRRFRGGVGSLLTSPLPFDELESSVEVRWVEDGRVESENGSVVLELSLAIVGQ